MKLATCYSINTVPRLLNSVTETTRGCVTAEVLLYRRISADKIVDISAAAACCATTVVCDAMWTSDDYKLQRLTHITSH